MPYAVRKKGEKFVVVNTETDEVKGESDTKEEAIAHMRALYANSDKRGMRNNVTDRAVIRNVRGLAKQIVDHTMSLEPTETDAELPPAQVEFEAALTQLEQMTEAAQGKSLNLSYVKSMGIELADPSILAVKSIGTDTIRGYTFIWGSEKITDVEHEYFTKQTDFWDATIGNTRPLTWDHAQDLEFKAPAQIGMITGWGNDDLGRWYEARLDRSHKYRAAIDALIKKGILGTSADSAPQYVERERTGKATWLKTWPWFASALTDVPAEPRMIGSLEFLKSIGVTFPETGLLARWEWEKSKNRLLTIR
jgi:hypothetical protein